LRLLEVVFGIQAPDKRDRLHAGTERPLAGLIRFGGREGARMRRRGLGFELRRMALLQAEAPA
jgi:hypothetical protein